MRSEPTPAPSIDELLAERGSTHGTFGEASALSQALKETMRASSGWQRLTPAQRESLEMQAHKISRILAGDPHHADHWADIQGYARLVEKWL